MAHIDDPFDQVESQHREPGGQGLAKGLAFGAAFINFLAEPTGTLGSIGAATAGLAVVKQFFAADRREARIEAFRKPILDAISDLTTQVDVLKAKVMGPDAEDAFVAGIRLAQSTARLEKARAFGQILGATLKQDSPHWQEAADFIRNLEEFTDADLQALKLLWNNQRTSYRVMSGAQRGMDSDANEYAQKWSGVLDHAQKAGISKDDWYAHCGRLGGFGFVVPVPTNTNALGESVYRLTGRAVRLLGLLGRNIDPGAYPAVRYHADGRTATVDDEDAERDLGEGWVDTPAAVKKP